LEEEATKHGYGVREWYVLAIERRGRDLLPGTTAPRRSPQVQHGKAASGSGGKGINKGKGKGKLKQADAKRSHQTRPPQEEGSRAGHAGKSVKPEDGTKEVKAERSPSHEARALPSPKRRRRGRSTTPSSSEELRVGYVGKQALSITQEEEETVIGTQEDLAKLKGKICTVRCAEEHVHLFRPTIFGPGLRQPSAQGRKWENKTGERWTLHSSNGPIAFPESPAAGDGWRVASLAGWPVSFQPLEKLKNNSYRLATYLRHTNDSCIDAAGWCAAAHCAKTLTMPIGDVMDTALFSFQGDTGYRFEISLEEIKDLDQDTEPDNTSSAWHYRCKIRATRKHSIAVL
jgi:hypothetical protein